MKILSVMIRYEHDVVACRWRARQIAGLIGFHEQDQTRIATAVSEIARNAFSYGGGGKAEYYVEETTPNQTFLIRITDSGAGITDLPLVLEGKYRSRAGMGLGIVGARRLMDRFEIESTPERGTTVVLGKIIPEKIQPITPMVIGQIAEELSFQKPQSLIEEFQQQNQELLHALDELGSLNRELQETNRGVVALYAELDEKAEQARRSGELKSRYLANMSHEFRTPINSIMAIMRLLMARTDGDLTAEQERQLTFVQESAQALSELINDLLDIAKVEAGKVSANLSEFEALTLFGTLRGIFRPLCTNPSVKLVFEDPVGLPLLYTDEGKVAQILRNLISNALKFTEQGEVRVRASVAPGGQQMIFSVSDTGMGIAPRDQERIFEEFTQLEHPIQKKVKGTGLGLHLSRKLAELLGGTITVESEVDGGSTFSVSIPLAYSEPMPAFDTPKIIRSLDSTKHPVLVIEDDYETLLLYDKYLKGTAFQFIPAQSILQARKILKEIRPFAIVLDILLPDGESWDLLTEVKTNESLSKTPVLVATIVPDRLKGMTLGAYDYCVKPVDRKWLLDRLKEMTTRQMVKKILIVDDEEVARYVIKSHLSGKDYTILEASNGIEGLQRARTDRPDVILLDLQMPGLCGLEVLHELKKDPQTRDIVVIIVTSKIFDREERLRLTAQAHAILSKETLTNESVVRQVREALTKRLEEK